MLLASKCYFTTISWRGRRLETDVKGEVSQARSRPGNQDLEPSKRDKQKGQAKGVKQLAGCWRSYSFSNLFYFGCRKNNLYYYIR